MYLVLYLQTIPKYFPSIFPLDRCKHDINIQPTSLIHKTALDLRAYATGLGARSDSHKFRSEGSENL